MVGGVAVKFAQHPLNNLLVGAVVIQTFFQDGNESSGQLVVFVNRPLWHLGARGSLSAWFSFLSPGCKELG